MREISLTMNAGDLHDDWLLSKITAPGRPADHSRQVQKLGRRLKT